MQRYARHPWHEWRHHRRQRRVLRQVRAGLARRGAAVDQLSDSELLDLIAAGRKVLSRAHVRGGDITAAFVMLVRRREKI